MAEKDTGPAKWCIDPEAADSDKRRSTGQSILAHGRTSARVRSCDKTARKVNTTQTGSCRSMWRGRQFASWSSGGRFSVRKAAGKNHAYAARLGWKRKSWRHLRFHRRGAHLGQLMPPHWVWTSYVSQPDGETGVIADTLIRSGAIDCVVIDSVAALTPRARRKKAKWASYQVGAMVRMMSHGCRKLAGSWRSSTTVIFISRVAKDRRQWQTASQRG